VELHGPELPLSIHVMKPPSSEVKALVSYLESNAVAFKVVVWKGPRGKKKEEKRFQDSPAQRLKINTMPRANACPITSIPPRCCVQAAVALQYGSLMLSVVLPAAVVTVLCTSVPFCKYNRVIFANAPVVSDV